jgi:RHS repeat-associated protein
VANASVPTTTYTYDANGNVTQAGGWSYVWDYLNRMLASGYNNSTTTYAYDATGARVLQTSTTSTTYYPSKFFSLASTTSGGTSWATSTNYIWLGDTLLATIDQKLYNDSATGTAIARYVHPDHLGSTNVVTDASGTIAQLLDYYPYGAARVSSTTFPTNEKRQYIGQLYDQGTGLNYLQARYYDSSRGQFVTQDPVFWEIGLTPDGQKALVDPQSLNSYAYANDNPITKKDPNGRQVWEELGLGDLAIIALRAMIVGGAVNTDAGIAANVGGNLLNKGQLKFDETPGQVTRDLGTGAILGVAGEAAGSVRVGTQLITNARMARLVKLAQQGAGAASASTAIDYANGQTDPSLLVADFTITTLSTIGAGKLVGPNVGRDVNSIFSPRFITGAQTARAANTEVVSSGSAAALWASFYSLQAAFNNYKATNPPSKTKKP